MKYEIGDMKYGSGHQLPISPIFHFSYFIFLRPKGAN